MCIYWTKRISFEQIFRHLNGRKAPSFLLLILGRHAAGSKLSVRPKIRGARSQKPEETHASLQLANTDSVRSHLMNNVSVADCIKLRGNSYQETCHQPSCYTLIPRRCWKISELGRPTTVSLFCHVSALSSPAGSLEHVCKPNMALIWPAPAPNPIIKPASLNISHWYGPFNLLRDMTVWVYCVYSQSHCCLVLDLLLRDEKHQYFQWHLDEWCKCWPLTCFGIE